MAPPSTTTLKENQVKDEGDDDDEWQEVSLILIFLFFFLSIQYPHLFYSSQLLFSPAGSYLLDNVSLMETAR